MTGFSTDDRETRRRDDRRALVARRLRRAVREAPRSLDTLPRRADPTRAPLGLAQHRLWLLDRLAPGNPAYNVLRGFRLEGRLSLPRLALALARLVARHEVLRARFGQGFEGPEMRFAPHAPVTPSVVDLRRVPPGRRPEAVARVAAATELCPFDLAGGRTIRLLVLRSARREHYLLLALHHILADAWSLEILLRDLVAFYEGRELEPAPSFGDFAAWQREAFSEPVVEAQLGFWRRRLEGLEPLELPGDRPRPASPGFRGVSVDLALNSGEALRDLAREERCSVYAVHLALLFVLLARLTGRRDLAVGTPVIQRERPEIRRLVGFLANTLVIRVEVPPRAGFRELTRRVASAVLEALDHQELPFDRLVEALQPERASGVHPLFQVLHVERLAPGEILRLGGAPLEPLPLARRTAKFDLTLELDDWGRGLLEAAADLFEPLGVRRLALHLDRLAAAAAADPDRPLETLDLLTRAERQQAVVEWAGEEDPGEGLLHVPFEERARAAPQAPALLAGGTSLSYRELEHRANRLAHRLIDLGVGPETPVALCGARRPELVVAMLGVLKAGGAYVPLDPEYPTARLDLLLEDSRAPILLADGGATLRLPDFSGRRLSLDDEEVESRSYPSTPPQRRVTAENVAYLIYTSGSTGRPKGVAIRHGGAAALLRWARKEFGGREMAGVLASTSVCFDLSVFELFAPLAAGGTVVLATDALELPRLPEPSRVTLVNTVPSAMAALLDAGGLPPTVRTVCLAGEPYPRLLARRLAAETATRRQLNLYGPSEDTTYSTGSPVDPRKDGAPAIGRPLAGSLGRVLDPGLRPLPVRVPGELFLAGSGLARGYHRRPALTADRFVPDPFSRLFGGRMYRTGDRVRWRASGSLEYLGRLDHQVKLRGFRIELGEVEAALAALPGVDEAAAAVQDDGTGPRLVAWVAGASPDPEVLRSALAERVPGFLVPQRFVVLRRLPRTPNGKLDRRALPAPPEPGEQGGSYVEPRTPVERLVAGLWAEALGVERVGAQDGFFALGGHSLEAAEAAARLRRILGVDVSPRLVFQHPTVAAFATALAARREHRSRIERAASLWLSISDLGEEEVAAALTDRSPGTGVGLEDAS